MEIKKNEIEKYLANGYSIRAETKFIAEKENHPMQKYRVGDLYEDKGVVAAVTMDGDEVKVLVVALKDTFEEEKTWDEAMKHFKNSDWHLPIKEECGLLIANMAKVQEALKEHGKEMSGWYWSSSECNNIISWYYCSNNGASQGGLDWYSKGNYDSVRPVLALTI